MRAVRRSSRYDDRGIRVSQAYDARSQQAFAAAVCRVMRESRRRQKLTQAEVAQRTGGLVSKAALANYETGHRSLRVDVLWVIAGALGEDLGSLLSAPPNAASHCGPPPAPPARSRSTSPR